MEPNVPPKLILSTSPVEGVRILAFNRPEKRNALSQVLITEFLSLLAEASRDEAVKVVVVTGTKNFFSAGADIKEIAGLNSEGARKCRYLEDLCNGMAAVRKPLIAAVEGLALGGGFEVALMCDLIFASRTSRFGLPEVSIGLIPGAGGTQKVTAALGKFKAMQMILLGEQLTAAEALEAGLVAKIFDEGTVLDGVVAVASQLATKSPAALALAKEAICQADSLAQDHAFERSLYYFAFGTKDKAEGVSAFLEKRAPQWDN